MKKYILVFLSIAFLFTLNCCSKDKKNKTEETYTKFPSPDWKEDISGRYPVSMTAIVQLTDSLKPFLKPNDKLAAFVKDTCRGIGTIVKLDSTSSVFFVLIHGTSSDQQKVSFKYYNTTNFYIYTTNDLFSFETDANYGTVDKPQTLMLTPIK